MEEKLLGVASTDTEEKYLQYEAFKKWTLDNLQILVRQGFGIEDGAETQKTTIVEIKGNMIKNKESLRIDESASYNLDKDYLVYEFVQAEHEEASLEAHGNNDKAYTEQHGEREEFETMNPSTANVSYSYSYWGLELRFVIVIRDFDWALGI